MRNRRDVILKPALERNHQWFLVQECFPAEFGEERFHLTWRKKIGN